MKAYSILEKLSHYPRKERIEDLTNPIWGHKFRQYEFTYTGKKFQASFLFNIHENEDKENIFDRDIGYITITEKGKSFFFDAPIFVKSIKKAVNWLEIE